MPLIVAHVLCFTFAAIDVAARALRYRLLLRALRHELRLFDALPLTMFGDAAAALTPMRAGGEPARIFAASRCGVPVAPAVLALAVENVLTYLIVVPAGIALAFAYGADWWRRLAGASPVGRRAMVVAIAIILLLASVSLALPRVRRWIAHWARHFWLLLRDLWQMPFGMVAACFALSAVSLAARVGILPVLVFATSSPPSLGVAVLASFGLLYGQLAVPTPSGAGPVDVAVLKGAAGFTVQAGSVLVAWRFYTTILVAVVGVAVGLTRYGHGVLSLLSSRRSR